MKKYTHKEKIDAQVFGKIPDTMLMELIEDYTEYYKWLDSSGLCHVLKMYTRRKLEELWVFVDSRGLSYDSAWRSKLYE